MAVETIIAVLAASSEKEKSASFGMSLQTVVTVAFFILADIVDMSEMAFFFKFTESSVLKSAKIQVLWTAHFEMSLL